MVGRLRYRLMVSADVTFARPPEPEPSRVLVMSMECSIAGKLGEPCERSWLPVLKKLAFCLSRAYQASTVTLRSTWTGQAAETARTTLAISKVIPLL